MFGRQQTEGVAVRIRPYSVAADGMCEEMLFDVEAPLTALVVLHSDEYEMRGSDFFLPAKTMERLDLHEENEDHDVYEDEVDAEEEEDEEQMDVSARSHLRVALAPQDIIARTATRIFAQIF